MTGTDQEPVVVGARGFQSLLNRFSDSTTTSSFLRFASIGFLSTVTHGVVLNVLVLGAGVHPTLANVGAFLTAFTVSYLGHYYFSFRSKNTHVETASKYFVAALVGLAINTLIFAVIVNWMNLHYMIAFAAVIVLLPPIMFLISKKFVFTTKSDQQTSADSKIDTRSLALTYGVPIFFFLFTAIYVALFHFKAPFFDQWSFVFLYGDIKEGGDGFERMFELHGAHWHATAYAILYGLTELTGMNHFYEGMVSVAFAGLGFVGLAKLITRGAAAESIRSTTPLLLALAAAMWFSLDQAINFLWTWQVAIFVNTAGAVWTVYFLTGDKISVFRFIGALLATTAAILSFATGLTLLPIGAVLLALHLRNSVGRNGRLTMLFTGVWLVYSSALAVAYWQLNFAAEGAYGSDVAALPDEGSVLPVYALFFVKFIASPIAKFTTDLAIPVFLLGGFLFIWAIRRSDIHVRALRISPTMLALLALMAYGVGAAILTGLGRAVEFGASQGSSSRYISFGNFFWIGLIMMVLMASAKAGKLSMKFPMSAPLVIIIVLLVLKTGNTISIGKKFAEQEGMRIEALDALLAARPEIDREALLVYASPHQSLDDDLAFLERRNLSFFRHHEEAEK